MAKSAISNDEFLYFNVEDLRYEDLPDLTSCTAPLNSDEGDPFSPGLFGKRKSRRRTGRLVTVNNQKIALFKYKGTVHAMDEKCPHMGGPLHLGDIEELGQAALPCIVCPWHNWKFSLENGFVKDPAHEKGKTVGIYPVQVTDGGELRVGFRSFHPDFFNGALEF